MKIRNLFVMLLLGGSLIFSGSVFTGCASWSNTGKGAAIGAGSGAALGAGIGALAGKGKGAAIGAAVGAARRFRNRSFNRSPDGQTKKRTGSDRRS